MAGIPILVALIIEGYISKFKGFGIELESKLNAPLKRSELIVESRNVIEDDLNEEDRSRLASDVMGRAGEMEKASVRALKRKTDEDPGLIKNTQRLSFVMGKENYYTQYAIQDYLQILENVKYLEVRERNGDLECVLPKEAISQRGEGGFVSALEGNTVKTEYQGIAIYDSVGADETLSTILEKFLSKELPFLPVTENRKLVGIIEKDYLFYVKNGWWHPNCNNAW